MRRVLMIGAALFSLTAMAGEVSKNVNFQLDKWIELEVTDGPVTLHRIRIEKISAGGLTKSKLFRPGNSENLQEIQIQLEFSNDSSRDWEAHIDLGWYDGAGKLIDGYRDKENLDESENHDLATVTLSTLKYGIEAAKKLKFTIKFERD
ncbi:MAG: hypothetical protein KDC35_16045 [Acidobacteria bacterium]|nr:hypothetical protein [Acidobacteriota bacterium]